ncbi:alkane hydroxylase MAH1-like [Ipomoea triloba]|uniref:alkane hydroxylase MAH1-like n=1 Tax=Ipomoea triloba TaxID=35885 RepID=UPI00125D7B06|nr:alkane hydroxylase MAH1-like [Ipomoea triloba]
MAELVIGYLEILVAVACFLLFYVWREDSKGFPRNYPIVGMLPGFLYYRNQAHQRVTNSMRLSGGTFLYKGPWFANMDMLATVDPANVHHVMSANFMNFPKGPKFKEMFEVLGEGIFNADLEMWRVQRKIARGFMMHARFHRFLLETSRVKVEQGLIPVLEHYVVAAENQGGSAVMDLQDLFQRYTFDTSCILITGYDPGCVSVDFSEVPFSKAMDDAEEAILVRHIMPECIWKLQRWVGVGSEKKLTQASNTLDQVIAGYIAKKRQEEDPDDKEETIRGCDLLTSYLRHQQSDQDTMGLNLKLDDQKFLRDTIMNLMIAGRDTTSSALTWFIWLVSTHPHVESKIREELTKTLIPKDQSQKWRVFNAEELKPLVYLHASICESLRLYPPVPFQHKEPVHTDTLPSGHSVHPKMKIMIPLYAMGRMESIWGEDAAEFKPERWISEKGTVKHEPSYKFMAFNAGPRTCLGKEIAFTQIKPVAASIIHNYQVKVVEGHPVEPNSSIILYMRHGFKVRLHRRSMLN